MGVSVVKQVTIHTLKHIIVFTMDTKYKPTQRNKEEKETRF